MSFDTPKGNENNETLSTQDIASENIKAAEEFAESNSTILSSENKDFKTDKKILDKISDVNGTLAAERRETKISFLSEVKGGIQTLIESAKYVYNDIFKDVSSMNIETIKKEINLTKADMEYSQNGTERYLSYKSYLEELKKELNKKEQN